MSIDTAQLASDLAAIEADMPDEIVLDAPDGRTLSCVAGQASRAKRLQEDGFMQEYDLTVVVRASELVDTEDVVQVPPLRNRFTHTRSGARFRIDKIDDSPDGVSYTLYAIQETG